MSSCNRRESLAVVEENYQSEKVRGPKGAFGGRLVVKKRESYSLVLIDAF